MKKFPRFIRWSAPYRFYQIYRDLGEDKWDNRDLLYGALFRGTVRTLVVFGAIFLLFQSYPSEPGAIEIFLVGFGAFWLAYTALRVHINRVHRRFVYDENEDVVSARRKQYDNILSITDSIIGVIFIAIGFSLRIA